MSRVWQCSVITNAFIAQTCRRPILPSRILTATANYHKSTNPLNCESLTSTYNWKASFGLKNLKSSFNVHTSAVYLSEEQRQQPQSQSQEDSYQEQENEHDQPNRDEETPQPSRQNQSEVEPGKESVIDRLRRLSMTSASEYELSPQARMKSIELAKQRKEIIKKGEQWRWDQKNLRPGGPGPAYGFKQKYNQNSRGGWRDEYDEEEDFGERSPRRSGRDNYEQDFRRGQPSQNSWREEPSQGSWKARQNQDSFSRRGRDYDKDVPEDYEVEMERLRERMALAKAKKPGVSSKRETVVDTENEGTPDTSKLSSGTVASSSQYFSEALHSQLQDWNSTSSSSRDTNPGISDNHANSKWSEDDFNFLLVASEPDTFGTLSIGSTSTLVKDTVTQDIQKELKQDEEALSIAAEEDEEEGDDTKFIPAHGERWTSRKLKKKVLDLLKEKKLKEAVDTYLGALAEGGFQFDHQLFPYLFNVLINECANVGYVEMAFRLYSLMKRRGYKEKANTFSSLLNACSNSPWDKEENLNRIDKLLVTMNERGFELNVIHYHVLIKAYGRLGETVRAFSVVDKMIQEAKLKPMTSTFNMLLQVCITDTKNGFRHALITWKKMQSMGLRPDIFSYNLFLKSVRECGIEIKVDKLELRGKVSIPGPSGHLLPPPLTEEDNNRMVNLLIVENPTEEEALLPHDSLDEVTVVKGKDLMKALAYPENRFAMIGGLKAFVSRMVRDKVGPNLKTLTQLLEVSNSDEITDVLSLLEAYKIKADVDFFNIVIKRYNELGKPRSARAQLNIMNSKGIVPNLMTWGALSIGCREWIEAKAFLKQMDEAKFTPNIVIMGSLLSAAKRNFNPRYFLHVMEETKRRGIPIDERYLMNLEDFYKKTQEELVNKEMGKPVDPDFMQALELNPEFGEHFALFKMRYPRWLKEVDIKVVPKNPWEDEYSYFTKHKTHKPRTENVTLELEPESKSSISS